ncbi:putative DNA binding domain-containing protein [Corynebacterium lizhenjunii]|uniref:Putative DNA binding domain-containing protein n=1 Tax=Corynebacterium lizhenjunii TaxID=2709394 RepID=A0A7T0KGA7_9CORY|nr:RNA-binding domain-containing protein [Corynebacterium lizhenjunii]QPK80077.1 putative DNA binding domain-containing protein [Corynebacterium lizhenjunii]
MRQTRVVQLIELLRQNPQAEHTVAAFPVRNGLPEGIEETVAAFANMPEGGTLLLGITQDSDTYTVTGVSYPEEVPAALATAVRSTIVPAPQLGEVTTVIVEDKAVVACTIPPQSKESKPFRIGAQGPAFIRSAAGNFRLSFEEEHFLKDSAATISADRAPVLAAQVDKDLDEELLERYLNRQIASSIRLRKASKEEQLLRTNVLADEEGHPTVAALYALGKHPQQFLPHLGLSVAAKAPVKGSSQLRATDARRLSGPLPDLLDQGMKWINQHVASTITLRYGDNKDFPELPPSAVREVLTNALIHRDLSAASVGRLTEVLKLPEQLLITNPGGLWGLSTSALGKVGSRPRNPILYSMCMAVATEDGKLVVDNPASGVPSTRQAFQGVYSTPPEFTDGVVSFQVALTSASEFTSEQLRWLATLPGAKSLSATQQQALLTMREEGELTNRQFREQVSIDSAQARTELQDLVSAGLAEVVGAGRATAYRLASADSPSPTPQQTRPIAGEPLQRSRRTGFATAPRPEFKSATSTQPTTSSASPTRMASLGNTPGAAATPNPAHSASPVSTNSSQPRRTRKRSAYISTEDKRRIIIETLRNAGKPLSKSELLQASSLSFGQLTPILSALIKGDVIKMEDPFPRSRNQRYMLAD